MDNPLQETQEVKHMNKMALALMMALLFSAVAGISFVNLAQANPFPTAPVISIESPTSKTCTENPILLEVTLVTYWDGVYFTSTRRRVSYCIDRKESIRLDETEYWFDTEKQASIFYGTAVLPDLEEGSHNLRVNAEYSYGNGRVFVSNSKVEFTIDSSYSPSLLPSPSPSPAPSPSPTPTPTPTPSPEPTSSPEPQDSQPFPTTIVIASIASAAFGGAGFLVYFIKRKGLT